MKRLCFILIAAQGLGMLASCGSYESPKAPAHPDTKPEVTDSGAVIRFPSDSVTLGFFKTVTITQGDINTELTAPARVVATVAPSSENADQNLVLFDAPDLTVNYTEMLQHIISIRQKGSIIQQRKAIIAQKQIELDRFQDLAAHGAGTGKDVSDAKTDLIAAQTDLALAQTDLNNERTAILEHESRLKMAGFEPQELMKARVGKVWVICDMPEIQVTKVKKGGSCQLQFTSYPDMTFSGMIESVGEVVDNITRMVKLRIGVQDPKGLLRAGMYANVSFGIDEGNSLSVPKEALLTVQGKDYVFVKKDARTFGRQEVLSGPQVGNRIILYRGVQAGDQVVTDGAMQLKGISFGY